MGTPYRCYGCPAKISSRWLCENCTTFARSMMGKLIQVRPVRNRSEELTNP